MSALRPSLAVALLLVLPAATCGSPYRLPVRPQRTLAATLDLPATTRRLEIQYLDGLLTLETGDRLECRVEIHLVADDDAALAALAEAVAPHVDTQPNGTRTSLQVALPPGADLDAVRTTWHVHAPRDVTIAVDTGRGAVVARNAASNLEVKGGSGVVEAQMAGGAATLATRSGSLILRGDYPFADVVSDLGRIDLRLPEHQPQPIDLRVVGRKGDVYLDLGKDQLYDLYFLGEERLVHCDPQVRVQWLKNVPIDSIDYLQGKVGDPHGVPCGQVRLDSIGPVYVRLQPEAATMVPAARPVPATASAAAASPRSDD